MTTMLGLPLMGLLSRKGTAEAIPFLVVTLVALLELDA
jgi:hypothetical protein